MKVEYLPADPGKNLGPRYFLRPETKVEQRFLTILRDSMVGKPNRLRMIGTENLDKDVLGLPAKPVVAAGFCIETTDGKVPLEFLPSEVDKMDVQRETSRQELAHPSVVSSTGRTKGMKIVKQDHPQGGPSTVIQEDNV